MRWLGVGARLAVTVAFPAAVLGSCQAGVPHGAPGAPLGAGFAVTERAETGPITALAIRPPFLWAAGAPGLRRWNLESGEYEPVGGGGEADTKGIAAIAIDDEGGAWVAGSHGVGRWVSAGGELRYEPKGAPDRVTALAPRRPARTEGIWAGGPTGLYRFDGRAFAPIEKLREIAVTSLTIDDDGRAVWVGTRGHGVFHVDGDRVAPVEGGEAIALEEVVGTAKTAAGTRVLAGNAGGRAHIYALTLDGARGYRAPAGTRAVAVIEAGGDAVLVAGPPGREQAYTVRPLGPTETMPAGGLHFAPVVPERGGRWAGVPIAARLPLGVTAAAAAGADVYVGSARMGIARGGSEAPRYLAGSELVGDAERLTVACVARARCFVVTDGPLAWQTDGDRYQAAHVGEPVGAAVLAVATDARGVVYAISAEAQPPAISVARHSGADAAGGDQWQPLHRIPLELPPKTAARATFAALSPAGALWVGLRAVSPGGDEVGHGAIEIDLSTGHAVEHRPIRPSEHASVESLPLPADVTGVLFDRGLTWYGSAGGISRFQEGQLRTWSENDGLASEYVHAIIRGLDGAPWAATSAGLVRFDGSGWRAQGTAALATRGLATDAKGRLWVATNKGLRVIAPSAEDNAAAGAAAAAVDADAGVGSGASPRASTADPGAAPVVLEGDMRDVAVDRFGRVWALGASSIALVQEK
jgi:hypothetical protein